ncbi:NUDIX hydrolase [Sporolactobacillus pectinivorans]|uniref:NUDIX hydrolase n=1 Tax=Sporolactobacillus pectinivorans TaxID=1591408 RepID=UPI000C25C485|nr:NUDIX domain-containing protein [Sporolactobacillus pectinivorans]
MGYIEEIRTLVGHRPLILVVAAVLILDKDEKVLLQERTFPKNVWGIPGGFMELGESSEETSKREVYEETGLTVDDLHFFRVYSGTEQNQAENGDQYYTVTVMYTTSKFKGHLIVDPNESISYQFHSPDDLPDKILNEHRTILNDFFSHRKK